MFELEDEGGSERIRLLKLEPPLPTTRTIVGSTAAFVGSIDTLSDVSTEEMGRE